MKFTAKTIDLNLELVDFSGQELKIAGPEKLTADQATKILIKIEEADKRMQTKGSAVTVLKEAAGFLVEVYGQDEAYWTGNFDPQTLMEIRKWFINEMAGVKKKD